KPGKLGLLEGNCPNCSGGIAINQVEKCAFCGAMLRSGRFDWVLAEITQASVWRGEDTYHPPSGLPLIRARDPGFNRVALEDRASVIFWRLAAADRRGSVDPLRPCATAEFCAIHEATFQAQRGGDGGRSFLGDRSVG